MLIDITIDIEKPPVNKATNTSKIMVWTIFGKPSI